MAWNSSWTLEEARAFFQKEYGIPRDTPYNSDSDSEEYEESDEDQMDMELAENPGTEAEAGGVDSLANTEDPAQATSKIQTPPNVEESTETAVENPPVTVQHTVGVIADINSSARTCDATEVPAGRMGLLSNNNNSAYINIIEYLTGERDMDENGDESTSPEPNHLNPSSLDEVANSEMKDLPEEPSIPESLMTFDESDTEAEIEHNSEDLEIPPEVVPIRRSSRTSAKLTKESGFYKQSRQYQKRKNSVPSVEAAAVIKKQKSDSKMKMKQVATADENKKLNDEDTAHVATKVATLYGRKEFLEAMASALKKIHWKQRKAFSRENFLQLQMETAAKMFMANHKVSANWTNTLETFGINLDHFSSIRRRA